MQEGWVVKISWTYSGDPSDSDRDAVRFLTGLTDSDDQRINDEELDWLLGQNDDDVFLTAAAAARAVGATYADQVDKTVGDLSLKYSQRADKFKELAAALDKQATSQVGHPTLSSLLAYAGGISATDKKARSSDSDYPPPITWNGQFDNPPVLWGSTADNNYDR
jgi:hypothetical protein